MHHRVTDFDTSGVAVEQHPAHLLFQQPQQLPMRLQIFYLAYQGRGELPVQTVQGLLQLSRVGHFDQKGGRAEHFFLQQRITPQQQADIGLEQLRLRLIALLVRTGQVRHP